ncbi:DUF1015 domain-containing protein [Adhaeribacter aquaticus]|uniref:DUF1015 domain-containing protein n=1 Tax=Adhaeribacter aquaticus TaxID=299567 RepID=UPI000405E0D2|nr:DUF1015 domain-containing protein [Adhaeribacter aquaticus]
MAEIRPIKGWRYAPALTREKDTLISPLFDVVSEKHRQALYHQPFNSLHLSVPQEPNAANRAANLLEAWKSSGILKQDIVPGIYGFYQYFRLPGSKKEYCRKGFICHIKAYDWSEKVILRHENTIPDAVNKQKELLAKTLLQTSPTHGLYTDPAFVLEPYLNESMVSPLYEAEDYQGIRNVLSVIHDARVIKLFKEVLRDKQVLLADGHHRYESSLWYRKKMMEANPQNTGKEGYHYHFMYLTNTESDDLKILPTHRVLKELPLSEEELIKALTNYFNITPQEEACTLNEVIAGKKWTFGLYLAVGAYKLTLKPDVHQQIYWNFPAIVKELDLTVLHFFVFEKILGLVREKQRSFPGILYERNFAQCLTLVNNGQAKAAFIVNEVTIEEVKQVCASGATLPQKSTFFYPKVITGLIFSTLKQHEFESEVDSCF